MRRGGGEAAGRRRGSEKGGGDARTDKNEWKGDIDTAAAMDPRRISRLERDLSVRGPLGPPRGLPVVSDIKNTPAR